MKTFKIRDIELTRVLKLAHEVATSVRAPRYLKGNAAVVLSIVETVLARSKRAPRRKKK